MFFKNSFRIFKCDLKKLARNWVALVIACGVALLPSLYAWINILASWDPYGNTGGVKVGVVNNDEGASIGDININIGAELIGQLKENKKLGWTFFDTADDGIEQCRKGKVYATIIIPKDFSSKLATLADEVHVKPQLDYYVNEKINAIAPKMTDSGASTLQKQITESFIQTVVQKAFDVLNPLGYDIDEHYGEIEKFQSLINLVDNDLPQVSTRLNNLIDSAEGGKIDLDKHRDDADFLRRVLGNAISFTDDVKNNTNDLIDRSGHTTAEMRASLDGMTDALASMENSLDSLGGKYASGKPDLTNSLSDLASDAQMIGDKLNSIESDLDVFDEFTRDDIKRKISRLRTTLKAFDDFLDTLEEGGDIVNALSANMKHIEDAAAQIKSDVADITATVNSAFDAVIAELEKLQNRGNAPTADISGAAAKLNGNSALSVQLKNAADFLANSADSAMASLKFDSQIDSIINKLELRRNRITTRLDAMSESAAAVQRAAKSARNAINSFGESSDYLIRMLHRQINESSATLAKINNILSRSDDNKILDFSSELSTLSQHLADLSRRISDIENGLSSSATAEDSINAAKSLCSNLRRMTSTLSNALGGSLDERIQTLLRNANSASTDLRDVFSRSIDGVDAAQEFLDKINNNRVISVEDAEKFRSKFPSYLDNMANVADKIKALSNIIDLKDVANMLQYDSESTGDFFASPVELNTTKLFPIKNYGAGLTPFYTTLCLWVGALLMCALFTTHAANADFDYSSNEEYMGKFFLFGSLAVIQGFIAALGDVVVLKVEIMHPILFIALSMLYSLVFTCIVYTLVALFDNVGKAIGVVFLVFQIAAAGGTFPIQVTPMFFQKINRFLPFTYAINGMREAVAGIVAENLLLDIAVLLLYFVLFLAIGLVLKRFANKALKRFLKMLGESGVIGH